MLIYVAVKTVEIDDFHFADPVQNPKSCNARNNNSTQVQIYFVKIKMLVVRNRQGNPKVIENHQNPTQFGLFALRKSLEHHDQAKKSKSNRKISACGNRNQTVGKMQEKQPNKVGRNKKPQENPHVQKFHSFAQLLENCKSFVLG